MPGSSVSSFFAHTRSGEGLKVYPRPQHRYTSRQMLKQLTLPDGPSWGFWHVATSSMGCIQDSHLTIEELLSVPGFADLKWQYIRTTQEWIPVFLIAPEDYAALLLCLDHVTYRCPYEEREMQWFTPKGFPRDPIKG